VRHEGGVEGGIARTLVELGRRLRQLQDRGLAEVPSTRLLIAAARLVASGIAPRTACHSAIVAPLSDEPPLVAARRDLVDATFPWARMAEAEDVLTDAARHATVFARDLWRRHRPVEAPQVLRLQDVARRIDLLVAAVFGRSYALRVAQPPAPPTWLARWMRRRELPAGTAALPATDGVSLWLPGDFGAALPHREAG